MRPNRTLTTMATALALTAALGGLAACGSDDSKNASDAPGSTTAPKNDETEKSSGGLVDICTKVTDEEIATVLGGPVTREEVPGGGCTFNQEDPRDPSLSLSSSAYDEGNGGFEGATAGVSSVLQGPDGGPVDGIGEEAYVKAGTTGGETLKGGGIAHVGGTLVQVTYLQSGDMTADAVKQKVVAALTLAVGKI
ncbi:MAG: hypothetical protein ACJ72D_23265 [Marmoricola sp.]